jgi:hypothetical protein
MKNPFGVAVADPRRTYAFDRHNQYDFRCLIAHFRHHQKFKPAQISFRAHNRFRQQRLRSRRAAPESFRFLDQISERSW